MSVSTKECLVIEGKWLDGKKKFVVPKEHVVSLNFDEFAITFNLIEKESIVIHYKWRPNNYYFPEPSEIVKKWQKKEDDETQEAMTRDLNYIFKELGWEVEKMEIE